MAPCRLKPCLDPVAKRHPSESSFAFALVRIAVAQICQSLGFKSSQQTALETITDLAIRHLQATAKLAAGSACLNGRTQPNFLDVMVALEDLASVQGFVGLSNARSPCLFGSAVVHDLMMFVKCRDEIPFAHQLPPRWGHLESEGNKISNQCHSFAHRSCRRHVPRWLPVAPVVEVKQKGADRKTEGRWGCMNGREEDTWVPSRQETAKRGLIDDTVMPAKRETVRFKLGLGFRRSKNRDVGFGRLDQSFGV